MGRLPRCAGAAVTRPVGRGNPLWVDSWAGAPQSGCGSSTPREGHVGEGRLARRGGIVLTSAACGCFGVFDESMTVPLASFVERGEASCC